jgi:hypothetical protein
MAVMLNRRAFEHAKELIKEGRIVLDERDAWSEHRPSAEQENEFIRLHGYIVVLGNQRRKALFALTVFRRDLVSQDILIRSRSPCPAIIFISEPDHPRSRTRSAKCSRMPPQHCSMPSGLPSNWCEAANRQMHRSS